MFVIYITHQLIIIIKQRQIHIVNCDEIQNDETYARGRGSTGVFDGMTNSYINVYNYCITHVKINIMYNMCFYSHNTF